MAYTKDMCPLCDHEVRGHSYQLEELMAEHIFAKHPKLYKKLMDIHYKIDKLLGEARKYNIYYHSIGSYRKNRK